VVAAALALDRRHSAGGDLSRAAAAESRAGTAAEPARHSTADAYDQRHPASAAQASGATGSTGAGTETHPATAAQA